MIADIDDIHGLDWLVVLAPFVLGIVAVIAAVIGAVAAIIARVRASKR